MSDVYETAGMTEDASLNERMRDDEKSLFKKDPRINVISKDVFEDRIQKVFHLLWSVLSKSFGPYGAPTLIYNYPYSHVTKDGFTIMKNLSMDCSDQLVDQAIQNMASDICGRLNYAVGDGTTSAVIATNNIYQCYLQHRDELLHRMILPRDILAAFDVLKANIIENLHDYVRPIRSNDPKELYDNIYKIVYISSNGDAQISDYIASMYAELQFPGIICEMASDGVTKKQIISGYRYDLMITDKLYINSDNNTMEVGEADVIILGVKVTEGIYKRILLPLNEAAKLRHRKLIVCASVYDDVALHQTISRDLMNEYSKTKEINMVLCTYRAISDHTRRLANDFAMLCNTSILDRAAIVQIETMLETGKVRIENIFNIDERDDIPSYTRIGQNERGAVYYKTLEEREANNIKPLSKLIEKPYRLGFVGKASLGLKNSLFTKFYYNEGQYNAVLKDAEMDLKETEAKYKKLGTFNLVVNQCQQRYYALKLKMGLIEIGADSELSQKMAKDAVEDAIRAAASAFNYGVVLGCNTQLIHAIDDTKRNYNLVSNDDALTKEMYNTLIDILRDGFVAVYKTVLENAFENFAVVTKNQLEANNYDERLIPGFVKANIEQLFSGHQIFDDFFFGKGFMDILMKIHRKDPTGNVGIHDLIVEYSVKNHVVFDVSTKRFTMNVVNSVQTDEEILIATIDLIGLLITGNQMVVTQKHNFD